MKRVVLILILLVVLLLVGCQTYDPYVFTAPDNQLVIPVTQEMTTTAPPVVAMGRNAQGELVVPATKVPVPTSQKGIRLYNAEIIAKNVEVGNYGAYGVVIGNETVADVTLVASFTKPDNLRSGYTYIGDIAKSWVIINPSSLVILANNVSTAIVTLSIPKDAILPVGNLEFWITYAYNPGGFFNYTINQRWLLER